MAADLDQAQWEEDRNCHTMLHMDVLLALQLEGKVEWPGW